MTKKDEFDTPSCEELQRRHKLLLTKAKKEYPDGQG